MPVPLLANPVAQILGDARRHGKVHGMTIPEIMDQVQGMSYHLTEMDLRLLVDEALIYLRTSGHVISISF